MESRAVLDFIMADEHPYTQAVRELNSQGSEMLRLIPNVEDESVAPFRLYNDCVLSASGEILTITPRESQQVSLMGDNGWEDIPLPASITLDFSAATPDKKHDVFVCVDPISAATVPDAVQVKAEYLAWTNETTRATALDTVDGVKLKNGDNTRRWIGTAYYDGTSVSVAGGVDPLMGQFFGTGDPNNMSGGTTTGVGMQQPGILINGKRYVIYGLKNDVLQSGMTLNGEILAGVDAVLIDANGVSVLEGTGSVGDPLYAYKFVLADGTVKSGVYGFDFDGDQITVVIQNEPGTNADGVIRLIGQSGTSSGKGRIQLKGNSWSGGAQAEINVESGFSTNPGNIYINAAGDNVDTHIRGETDNDLLTADASTDRVGIGTAAPATKLHITENTAVTNALNKPLTVGSTSSGTPAAGLGTAINFTAEDSGGNAQVIGHLGVEFVTVTNGAEDSRIAVGRYAAGSLESGALDWGTYTPTLSNTTNVAASTASPCQWCRVGNMVTVSGALNVDPTTNGIFTVVGISLPIASNLGVGTDLCGTAASNTIASSSAAVVADTTNDRANMSWVAQSAANHTMAFIFMYKII